MGSIVETTLFLRSFHKHFLLLSTRLVFRSKAHAGDLMAFTSGFLEGLSFSFSHSISAPPPFFPFLAQDVRLLNERSLSPKFSRCSYPYLFLSLQTTTQTCGETMSGS